MSFEIKIPLNFKLRNTVEDPTSLGRYLGDEYFSFFVDEGNILDVYSLEKNSRAKDIWTLAELKKLMNFTSVNLLIVYRHSFPAAYLAYTIRRNRISLWNVTVQDSFRLQGLGSGVIRWMAKEYPSYDVATTLRETDLESQIFLRQTGFMCTKTVKEAFANPEEDGYFFARLAEAYR
jgi:hypothetical protein